MAMVDYHVTVLGRPSYDNSFDGLVYLGGKFRSPSTMNLGK